MECGATACITGVSPLLSVGNRLEALLRPAATPAAIPLPDPEKTRESDGGALMFESCELDMAAVVMAIRNFRAQRQEATADNLSVGSNTSIRAMWSQSSLAPVVGHGQ